MAANIYLICVMLARSLADSSTAPAHHIAVEFYSEFTGYTPSADVLSLHSK